MNVLNKTILLLAATLPIFTASAQPLDCNTQASLAIEIYLQRYGFGEPKEKAIDDYKKVEAFREHAKILADVIYEKSAFGYSPKMTVDTYNDAARFGESVYLKCKYTEGMLREQFK